MHDWPVTIIPNAIDTSSWVAAERWASRDLLRLDRDTPVIVFGAMEGTKDQRKGFDLLRSAFAHLKASGAAVQILVLGETTPKEPPELGFPVRYAGRLHDDVSLRVAYSAADAVVVPSRQDNSPNIAVEALACGTPVVAFDVCGMPDLIRHKETGYLAHPFDTSDLASGIEWVLAGDSRRLALSTAARRSAVNKFSFPVIASRYSDLYEETLEYSRRV